MQRWVGFFSVTGIVAAGAFAGCSSSSSVAPGGADAAPDARVESVPDGGAADGPLCVNGVSVDGDYPKRPTAIELLGTVPNLSLPGLAKDGTKTTVQLSDYYEPCAAASRLLVVRVTTAWCGTCRYALSHTMDAKTIPAYGARLRFLDVLVSDETNAPATADDLVAHRARIDAPDELAADPSYQLQTVSPSQAILPLYVLIDTRTMQIRNYLTDPDPAELQYRLSDELAILDRAPPPAYPPLPLTDDRFAPNEWAVLAETKPVGAPPADPTNEKSDDAAAAALGTLLFADKTLSPTGTVSCASCHDATKAFADALPVSEGVAHVDRNAPSLGLAAFTPWQFWDGRADSLWAQATGPFEAAKEFNSSRLFVAHQIVANYKSQYEAVWTKYPLPDMSDTVRFPLAGKPGDTAYDAMAQADKDAVTRVLVNVAKSIAAFERTIRVKTNRLDDYLAGSSAALTAAEKKSLMTFVKVGCPQCHWGPRLTDDAFHVTRFPTGRQDGTADRGRIDVIPNVLTGEFTTKSTWSDAPAPHAGTAHLTAGPTMLGAFKTPALRGVAETAPYGHGGALLTLLDVAKNYSTAGLAPGSPLTIGDSEPWLPHFDPSTVPDLVPIMQLMTAEPYVP